MLERLDAAAARRWAVVTRAAFAARRAEIDALNVFPVPDGDTGTNLYLSLDAALDRVRAEGERAGTLDDTTLRQETAALSEAMLRTARGNSGVILSQLVRGFAESLQATTSDSHDASGTAGPVEVVAALAMASDRARSSVTRPVEGTILSVARAAAEGAAAADGGTLAQVCVAATAAAHRALLDTPNQLEPLGRAGVVDAGGAGYLLLIESLTRVVQEGTDVLHLPGSLDSLSATGRSGLARREGWGPAVPLAAQPEDADRGVAGAGPSHEVMYLLDSTDERRVDVLREALDRLGDSLLVVGGPGLWNVHVHVDDIGAAVEAGVVAGRPHRIRVTALEDRGAGGGGEHPATARLPLAVVACAAGAGLAALFEGAGAVAVASSRGHRAGATTLLDAVRATGATEVIVLPNSPETRESASAAADAAAQEGVTVHVVRSRTAVQVIAALAVFDADLPARSNVVAMADAAAATRHGAVAVATSDGLTSAGTCAPGDVLGIVHGDVVALGTDLRAVAADVVARLLSSGGEILTVVAGADAPAGLAAEVDDDVRRIRRDLEVVHVDGGQPAYALLLGVE